MQGEREGGDPHFGPQKEVTPGFYLDWLRSSAANRESKMYTAQEAIYCNSFWKDAMSCLQGRQGTML
jgi:hypothetical protein